jgi:hypothetical protein
MRQDVRGVCEAGGVDRWSVVGSRESENEAVEDDSETSLPSSSDSPEILRGPESNETRFVFSMRWSCARWHSLSRHWFMCCTRARTVRMEQFRRQIAHFASWD